VSKVALLSLQHLHFLDLFLHGQRCNPYRSQVMVND
jgi:hypothetical protein